MTVITTRFDVPEIHCGHCKSSIEGAVAPVGGVRSVAVDVTGRTVTVEHDTATAPAAQLTTLIEEQGYDVASSAEVS